VATGWVAERPFFDPVSARLGGVRGGGALADDDEPRADADRGGLCLSMFIKDWQTESGKRVWRCLRACWRRYR
jgi:hypothetical protein